MKFNMKYVLVLSVFMVALHAVERPFSRQVTHDLLSYDLLNAVERNDSVTLKKLINQGANLNAKYEGKTPLMVALHTSNGNEVVIVDELLKNGANPNLVDASLMSPLEYATQYQKDPKVINLLLQYGAQITPRASAGYTPGAVAPQECPYEQAEQELKEWEFLPTKEEIAEEEASKQRSLWDVVKYYLGY